MKSVREETEYRVATAEFFAGATDVQKLPPPDVVEVAFAGRSNVGKSSLLNALLQRRNLVRTSRTPGCTRQINVFEVALAEKTKLHFVDLPGYGYAKRSKDEKKGWGAMLEGYLKSRPSLRALVILVDVRRGVEEEDEQLAEFMRGANAAVEVMLVATKLDKLPLNRQKPAMEKIRKAAGEPLVAFSAVTGDGRELLWRRILGAAQRV